MTAAVVELDPRKLAQHPANIRRAKGDLTGLVASVRQLGILQPIVVEQLADGGHQVLAGHRRLAAALKVGLELVPVRVVDLEDNPSALAMLAENQQRKDLTVAEEADAYLQLQAEGLDVAAIAKRTGVDEHRVAGAVKAAGSKKATSAAHKHDLTLEQTLVLAEFDGDPKAVKTLTDTALKNPGQFDHVASRLREQAKAKAAYEKQHAQLQADGVKILKKGTRPGWSFGANCKVDYLSDAAGKTLTAAAHKDCPGHAAVIEQFHDGPEITLVCTDPAKHGHRARWGGDGSTSSSRKKAADMTPAEREKASTERKAVIQNNKDWKAATPVRLEFVRKLVKRRAAPKGALRFAVEELSREPHWIAAAQANILEDLTGKKSGGYQQPDAACLLAKGGTEAQLPLALVALVAAAAETSFQISNRPYERTDPALKRYLEFLRDAGYALAPVEELVVKAKKGGRR